MNMTVIKRTLRIFAPPLASMLAASLGAAVLCRIDLPHDLYLATLTSVFLLIGWMTSLGLFAWSAFRLLLNARRLYQWEWGELNDGCARCDGPMMRRDQRFGPYSRCRVCGAERTGWY